MQLKNTLKSPSFKNFACMKIHAQRHAYIVCDSIKHKKTVKINKQTFEIVEKKTLLI